MTITSFENITWQDFENLCLELIKSFGIVCQKTSSGKDGGIDIIGEYSTEFIRGKVIVQCKKFSTSNKVGRKVVQELYGNLHDQNAIQAIIMTTSYFTSDAEKFAENKPIRLINIDELANLVNALKKTDKNSVITISNEIKAKLDKIDKIKQIDLNKALEDNLRLINDYPDSSDCLVSLASIYLLARDSRKDLSSDPQPYRHYDLKVEDLLIKAIRLNPYNKYAYLAFENIYDGFEKRIKVFLDAYKYLPTDNDVLTYIAGEYLEKGKEGKWIERIDTPNINFDYRETEILEERNIILKKENKIYFTKALEFARQGLAHYPNDDLINLYMGEILYYLDERYEAKKHLFKAAELNQGLKDTVETILGVPYIKFNIVFRYDINSYKNFPPE